MECIKIMQKMCPHSSGKGLNSEECIVENESEVSGHGHPSSIHSFGGSHRLDCCCWIISAPPPLCVVSLGDGITENTPIRCEMKSAKPTLFK